MCVEQIISVAKDITLAVAGIVGAIVAIRGLNTWNRQLKGGAEYELARRVLRATYRLRDSFKILRDPFLSSYEQTMPDKEEAEKMTSEELSFHGTSKAYQTRWNKVIEAHADLQAELLEGEVLWGRGILDHFGPLHKLERELLTAVRDHLVLLNPKAEGARKVAIQKRHMNTRDILYDNLDEDGDDFTKDVIQAIQKIENFLKPHLRR